MSGGGALAFREGEPASAVAAGDRPPEPGGNLWVDVPRAAAGDAPWVRRLHPVTSSALTGERRHLAAVQPGYVHVRLDVLTDHPRQGPHGATPAAGAALRGPAPQRLARVALDLVVGRDFALTIAGTDIPATDAVWDGYAAGERRAGHPAFAVYQALAAVVDGYRREGLRLLAAAESVDQRLVRLSQRRILAEIVGVRRYAMDLRDIVAPAVDALRLLAHGDPVPEAERPYFGDLWRQAKEVLDGVEQARDTMAEAVEAYTSVQSTQMNRVMQVFTVVAVLFGPPTLVASIYGMNFHMPEYHWRLGYPWALGLMFVVTVAMVTYLRIKDWL